MPARAIKRLSREDLSALLNASIALAGSLELDDVVQTALERTVDILGFATGSIYLTEGDTLRLRVTTPAHAGDVPPALATLRIDDHPRIREAIAGGEPSVIESVDADDLSEAERVAMGVRQLSSALFIPLVARGGVEGLMVLGTRDGAHSYNAAELDLCRALSAQIALAVANARLFEAAQAAARDLRAAYDATLAGWSLAMELRDEETGGHTVRSAELTVEMASRLGVAGDDLAHIRRGALLHDIGKMAVPDAVLRKPGPLSDAEWAVMRKHPEHAQRFLSQIDYLQPALDIPYCHHERWNGTGYPRGLRGQEIPLSARIFAVVDVYDALTSDRPYRPAWTEEQAIAHIQLQAGLHFDPVVVEAFMEQLGRSQ